ncbi:MAG: NAD(P)/FAD-dependent oxidoreductase [Vicinamibacterales bacterium]|nr:NAD(P)/FAD-dependent oxidoreductase [Vicinamibacterales bacterium]
MSRERWAVVGGGLLGMTLAHRLAARGHAVSLIEAAPHWGGLASAWRLGDVTWDRHYHVILMSDLRLRALLEELGLEREIRWVQGSSCFYTDGRTYPMNDTLDFLRFPPLGPIDKLRLGATILYASRLSDWKSLEQVPVGEWLTRLSGRRTYERIWRPLLKAKLGENHEKASAAFIWAIIARLYAARRSGLKREMFGYVHGGYARINDRFAEVLAAEGVSMRQATPVRSVRSAGAGGVRIELPDGSREDYDRAVVTLAAPLAARLCPDLEPGERARLEGVEYQGIVCASVLLRRPLGGYYVTNITDDWVPFTAVIETTALVDPAELGGHQLVYLPRYVPSRDPSLKWSDQEVRERFIPALRRMHPHLADEDVLAFQVSRVPYVLPFSTLGYSERLPSMTTSIPGVHIVNSAHIVNGTLNVNETVQLAERAVPLLAG